MPVDQFCPVSKPNDDYICLPKDIKINWIDNENNIECLSNLLTEPFVGIDAEWKMDLFDAK